MTQIQKIVLHEIRQDKNLKSAELGESELLDLSLLGRGAALDSIGLVNLIFAIEERIRNELGVLIEIASERAMSQTKSPFRTVRTLIDFVSQLVDEAKKVSSAKS
jgi:acyl carrier protein